MALPFSPNTVYQEQNTPAIKHGDLNDLQLYLAQAHRLVAGSDFHFEDEFDRGAVTSTMWDAISGTPSIVTDFANNGFWAARMNPGAGNNWAIRRAVSGFLPWRTNDLRMHARCRVATLAGTGYVSVYPGGAELGFIARATGPNWKAYVSGVETDLGVPFLATYQHLDILRVSGVAYFFINGALRHSAAFVRDMTGDSTGIDANAIGGGIDFYIDAVKMSSVRT